MNLSHFSVRNRHSGVAEKGNILQIACKCARSLDDYARCYPMPSAHGSSRRVLQPIHPPRNVPRRHPGLLAYVKQTVWNCYEPSIILFAPSESPSSSSSAFCKPLHSCTETSAELVNGKDIEPWLSGISDKSAISSFVASAMTVSSICVICA